MSLIHRHPNKQNGFTLIEVLIAVLVVAVGLLGMAALQINSIQSNTEGFARAQALAIAELLVGRVKANRLLDGADMKISNSVRIANLALYNSGGAKFNCTSTVPTQCVGSTSCTASQMAAFDRYQVCKLVLDERVNGVGVIPALPGGEIRTSLNSDRLSVYVYWEALAARVGEGQQAVAFNTRCSSLSGAPAGKDCVVIDVVP